MSEDERDQKPSINARSGIGSYAAEDFREWWVSSPDHTMDVDTYIKSNFMLQRRRR